LPNRAGTQPDAWQASLSADRQPPILHNVGSLVATPCRRREEFERNPPALSRELSIRGFVTQPGAAISRTE
jgi:hypothetical protein